jgi:7-carboxy-7-deazaguanine synthase (Cx14CxxC type)
VSYAVEDIFYTLQGEGLRAGRPAVFCRFAGCNLWSGREEDRERATCRFCDTDFVGTDGVLGGRYEAQALAEQIAALWPAGQAHRYVVLTGGEPLLQVDAPLLKALHAPGFESALETNGSLPVPAGVDWICVSPKAGADWVQRQGHELKLVFPQPGLMPGDIGEIDFQHLLLQPMDSPLRAQHTRAAIDWCMAHPRWRLSLQTHKILNIP